MEVQVAEPKKRGRPRKVVVEVPISSVEKVPKNIYTAYALLRKKDSGGLYMMRRLTIQGMEVLKIEDTVEDFASILIGKIESEIETGMQ